MQVQTTTSYRLTDDSRRTVGPYRQLLNHRHLSDDARVVVDGDRISIEWAG
jgi:hypothetical protein